MRRALGLYTLVLAVGVPVIARAQQPTKPPAGESPSTGIRLFAPTPLADADATTLELNPAGLGRLTSWSLAFQHSELRGDSRLQGTGDAIFAAAPLPFFRSLVLGAGLQWLRPADAIGYPDSAKLTLGAAWRIVPEISLGATVHRFFVDSAPELSGLTTLDLGLVLFPFPWLGAGFTLHDVTTPVVGGLPLQRVYDLEIAARPWSERRLELGVGAKIGERRGDIDPFVRLSIEPIWGVRVLGYLELLRRDLYRSGDELNDVRATVALGVSLERLALTVGTFLGRGLPAGAGPVGESTGARSAYQGLGIGLRATGKRERSALTTGQRIVMLELNGEPRQRRWVDLVRWLDRVERNETIRGVLLRIDGLALSWAEAQELRLWVKRLRHAGKQVFAHLTAPSAGEYYAVAGASRVLLDPSGGIRLQGLVRQTFYLRGMFDKIGMTPQFLRIAQYKTAPETFTRTDPSAPAKEVTKALLDDGYDQLTRDLAADRHLQPEQMRQIIDHGPFIPRAALDQHLVDELVEPEQLAARIAQLGNGELVDAAVVDRTEQRWPGGDKVAVVLLDGDIVHGKSSEIPLVDQHLVGDRTIVASLERARRDPEIAAVVLRINSPGGSALASYQIWRAVRKLREVKPVIVSLSTVAASGGYFAACAGDVVFAMPATITGSIGIFTGKFDIAPFLAKLGIAHTSSERGKRATMDSLLRPYSPEEQAFIASALQYYYRQFLGAVSEGRHRTVSQIDAVARGRVWTGRQARQQHLVDRFGGLIEAVHEAATRAGLPTDRPPSWVVLPQRQHSLLARAVALIAPQDGTLPILPPALRDQLRSLPTLLWYAQSGEALARLPYDIAP